MTKRLQVLLDDQEMADLQAIARVRSVTVAELVRGALRTALEDPSAAAERKLGALRRAGRYTFPSGDIEAMLGEIETGYRETPGRRDRGRRRNSQPA